MNPYTKDIIQAAAAAILFLSLAVVVIIAVFRKRPHPWRVYEINHCEWVAARSLEEAIECYYSHRGDRDPDMVRDAHKLTAEEMQSKRYSREEEYTENNLIFNKPFISRNPVVVSFQQELDDRVRDGMIAPEYFATSEN